MVKLLVGKKGTGKTKHLIDLVHETALESKGNVVCIEKGDSLTYDIKSSVRLISAAEYGISDYEKMFGFVCGIMSSDYDCTHIFIDSITNICGEDMSTLTSFFTSLIAITERHNLTLISTISADAPVLPVELHPFMLNV